MNSNICILIYTNSEYGFLWDILLDLINKYVDKNIQIIWLTDDNTDEVLKNKIPKEYNYYTYSDSLIWTKRVWNCIKELKYKYILFLHDDWIPIGNVFNETLNNMVDFMTKYSCDFLLSYSHISVTSKQEGINSGIKDYYFYKESSHIFQPAIWKRDTFIDFCFTLNKKKTENEDGDCLRFMSNKNCWSIQNRETVTSLRTTNSLFYPHMHVLSQGLWNFTKYPTLKILLESYNIDTSTRGVHSWWELDTQ
jgi:hypothetical protein